MGNGSPRLLTGLFARTAALAVAALFFAPVAFADGLVPGRLVGGTPAAAPSVPAPVQAAVDTVAAAAPAAPTHVASAPATTVDAASTTVESRIPPRPALQVAAAATKPSSPLPAASPRADAPSRITHRAVSAPARSATHRPILHVRASSPTTTALPAPRVRTSHLRPQQSAGPPTAAVQRPQLPQPPAPLPAGAGGAVGGSTATAGGLLLLALIVAAAAFAPPGLTRSFRALLAALRPHPYLLRLERPD
jgi:hypothetical protein